MSSKFDEQLIIILIAHPDFAGIEKKTETKIDNWNYYDLPIQNLVASGEGGWAKKSQKHDEVIFEWSLRVIVILDKI